jgi:hypothetical protein
MNKQKEKELKKEIYEKAIKDKEVEKIRQHKEKCRQKGLLLVEKNEAIDRKNQRIVELGREHRVMTRINQFDHNKISSSGSSNSDRSNNEMEIMHTPQYQLKMNAQMASSFSLRQSSLQSSSSSSSSLRKDSLNDMADKNDDSDDDDDFKYEYDNDGDNYDVFNDVDDHKEEEDDDDDDDDDVDCNNNIIHPFENINSIITNNINNRPINSVPPSTTTTYLHSYEWKQLLLLSNEKRDIVLHSMMEKMTNAEMFQQEVPSLIAVIQEVHNDQRAEEGKNVKEKNMLDRIKGQDTLKVHNNSLKNGEISISSTGKASDNDVNHHHGVNVDTITQPLSIDKLRQYRLRHYA